MVTSPVSRAGTMPNAGQSSQLKELATRLSTRIERLEDTLNATAGRYKVEVSEPSADGGTVFRLRTHRDGDRWIVQWKEEPIFAQPGAVVMALRALFEEGTWRPLRSASLEVKVQAVALLPKLFEAMELQSRRLIGDLTTAHASLDVLEQKLGLSSKEGR